METLNAAINQVNTILWSYVLIVLLIGLGLYFTFRTGFVQIRLVGEMVRLLAEGIGTERMGNQISSFQAFCVSTASRVGVGMSSVREAMKILEAFGVVEIRRADGVYVVKEPRPQMVDPMLLGSLAAGHGPEDLADLYVRMQGLVAEDLMDSRAQAIIAKCAGEMGEWTDCPRTPAGMAAGITSFLEELSQAIRNPLVRELFLRTAQMGAVAVERALAGLGEEGACTAEAFCRDVLSALSEHDAAALDGLLARERAFLLAASTR